ncbi:DUF637 domain-containing protein, partial [Paraburkholderia kururiensis]|uniref:DUF637 domain-containing protein n=1 Tax=Paraburkholderia kururiensis TaxID=984307 RepID=UPI001F42AFBB
MPEVLLPQNYATVSADGEITGTNVTLDYANSILNTGTVTARDLTVNTGTLTNEQRSTNIGVIYGEAGGESIKTTGTVVQQGGFMSAMNYDLNAQSINQIGGALQKISADGSVDTASTQAMLDSLKSQLGGSFTQSTVSNDLHTEVIGGMQWYDQLWMTVVIIGISIMSAGAASAAMGTMASATGSSMFAAASTSTTGAAVGAGVGNIAVSAAISGMVNSALTQSAFGNGSFSVGQMFEAGATSFVTAGLMNGITVNGGSLGWTWGTSNNSLAALAGVQTVGNAMVPQAGAASGSLPTQLAALAGEAAIQAGVQTGIEGGSFLTNLRNSAVADVAAAAAYSIGNAASIPGSPIEVGTPGYWLAHAALGCAAGAATGQGCGGGAIGGAASAALSPAVVSAIDPTGAPLDPGQQAALAAFATLAGGGLAGLAGVNVNGAMTAAQNEAINNAAKHIGGVNPDAATHDPGMQGYDAENDTHRVLPSSGGVANEAEAGDNVTVGQGTPVGAGLASTTNNSSNPRLLPAPTNSEPWMTGAALNSFPSPSGGMYIQMAMAPGQTNPGGWGTLDSISSVSYVRNNLAVTPAFKPQIGSVQLFYIPPGVQVQVGTVGPQTYNGVTYPGGGNQVQILNYFDRSKLVPIGSPRPIK